MEIKIKNFTELNAWKEGHELVLMIYKVTKEFPRKETFVLTSQILRAVISVTSNIAEGFGRHNLKEKIQFYFMAEASLAEVQNQLGLIRSLKKTLTISCQLPATNYTYGKRFYKGR